MTRTDQNVRDAIGDRVRQEAAEYVFGFDTGSTHAASMSLRDVLVALLDRDVERREALDRADNAERIADDLQEAADDKGDAIRLARDELTTLTANTMLDHDCNDEDSTSLAYIAEEVDRIAANLNEALS